MKSLPPPAAKATVPVWGWIWEEGRLVEGRLEAGRSAVEAAVLRPIRRSPVARVYRDIGEVKQLRLVGYTLVLKNRDLLERELRNRFKTSKYFSDAEDGTVLDKYEPNTEALNMTSFEMRVTLKEPIKK